MSGELIGSRSRDGMVEGALSAGSSRERERISERGTRRGVVEDAPSGTTARAVLLEAALERGEGRVVVIGEVNARRAVPAIIGKAIPSARFARAWHACRIGGDA